MIWKSPVWMATAVRIAEVWMVTMNHTAKTWAVNSARNALAKVATILTGVPWATYTVVCVANPVTMTMNVPTTAAWEDTPARNATVWMATMNTGVPWAVAWRDSAVRIAVLWMAPMSLGVQATVWICRHALPAATRYAHATILEVQGNARIAMAADILTGPTKNAMFATAPAHAWSAMETAVVDATTAGGLSGIASACSAGMDAALKRSALTIFVLTVTALAASFVSVCVAVD